MILTSLKRQFPSRRTLTFAFVLITTVGFLRQLHLFFLPATYSSSLSSSFSSSRLSSLSRLLSKNHPSMRHRSENGQLLHKRDGGLKTVGKDGREPGGSSPVVEPAGSGLGSFYNAPNCSVMDFLSGPDPSAREAYDPGLVCGPAARDRDVICSTFFSQIGLHDDGDCLRASDDSTVPRIVYYVIFGEYNFKFWHYVSIMAAKRHIAPSALYVVGDAHPIGYWWQRLLRDCKGVRFVYRPRPVTIGNQTVKYMHHRSDLVRLQMLLLNGGIYLDADMVMVRDPWPVLQHDITLGLVDNGTGMGNAFIAAKRNSPFVREWYENYNNYTSDKFFKNSLHVPRDMWHKHPGRVHMESQRLYRPNWFEADKLFKGWTYDWRQNYAVHVWTNGNPVPKTEQEIETSNTTIAQVFRNALYGDPRPRGVGSG